MADTKDTSRFPHLRIEGGPDAGNLRIIRDGKELRTVLEFQINGGVDAPVTATFREIVVFDGNLDIMPERRVDTTH